MKRSWKPSGRKWIESMRRFVISLISNNSDDIFCVILPVFEYQHRIKRKLKKAFMDSIKYGQKGQK